MIDNFKGQYAFLSNFSTRKAWPIVYDGVAYPCVEIAYQAQKTLDPDVRRKIASCTNSLYAYAMGQRVKLRPDWDDIKWSIAEELMRYKFKYPEYHDLLIATYPHELIDKNSRGDTVWGVDESGNGENELGKLLMKIREDLMKNDK